MKPLLLILAALTALAAIPPLTPEQVEQLSTAEDGSPRIDEGALYPLLQNALEWTPGDETGAMVPDYQAIQEAPQKYRGRLFLIEGYFYQAFPAKLVRPLPGNPRVQEWSLIKTYDQAMQVLVVDGPAERDLPRRNQRVRMAARFFKMWQGKDQQGTPTLYPVFVGRAARTVPASGGASLESAIPNPIIIGVVVLAVAFAVVTLWRHRVLKRFEAQRTKERAEEEEHDRVFEEEPEGAPLPEDPIEAMKELERRRREKGRT
jgi:hypothetical protein